MVFITRFLGAAALLSSFAAALPRPDSAINEPAVSAPDGTPITEGTKPTLAMNKEQSSTVHVMTTTQAKENAGTTTSTAAGYAMTTAASSSHTTAVSYGSGSSNWDNGFKDCVQQCIASFGGSSATYKATATAQSGSSGSGATHTVIVAPTQGVLRYIPFAVNASVGDTIKFMWGANNHTVTKSSSLLPCNRTADAVFASGTQNKDFSFTQVVNDTAPTYFFCGTPTHCQKGMFGIINPPNAVGSATSVGGMMSSLAANNSNVAAYSSYTEAKTSGNEVASKWGSNIDMASLPEWSHELVAENVMYTRTFLAANEEVISQDGSIDLGSAGSTPLMIPQDISVALASSSGSTPASPAGSPAATPSTQTTTGALGNQNSGALSMSSSKVIISVIVACATFMML